MISSEKILVEHNEDILYADQHVNLIYQNIRRRPQVSDRNEPGAPGDGMCPYPAASGRMHM